MRITVLDGTYIQKTKTLPIEMANANYTLNFSVAGISKLIGDTYSATNRAMYAGRYYNKKNVSFDHSSMMDINWTVRGYKK